MFYPTPIEESDASGRFLHAVNTAEVILSAYPDLICIGAYPAATSVIEVPFKLKYITVVRKKPYSFPQKCGWRMNSSKCWALESPANQQPHSPLLSQQFRRKMAHLECALSIRLSASNLVFSPFQCRELMTSFTKQEAANGFQELISAKDIGRYLSKKNANNTQYLSRLSTSIWIQQAIFRWKDSTAWF